MFRPIPLAVLTALLSAPALAQPEPHDSLLKRVPKLAISGPVKALYAPLTIGGTETGLVLQHGYAAFLFMEADPKKIMPNLRWRGVSRQSLQ